MKLAISSPEELSMCEAGVADEPGGGFSQALFKTDSRRPAGSRRYAADIRFQMHDLVRGIRDFSPTQFDFRSNGRLEHGADLSDRPGAARPDVKYSCGTSCR